MMDREKLVGSVGVGEQTIRTETMEVSMGPQHPSTHGVLRVVLKVDGEWIVEADPDLGYLHRSFEKLGELRTYPQGIFLTDRWDYVSAMNNNWVYCLAVEKLLGLQVPEKAEWIRVLISEMQRIASHLVFMGTYGLDVGALTPFFYCFREREKILDLFEEICGARLTYNFYRIGGVSRDVPRGWLDKVEALCDYLIPRLDELDDLLTNNKVFLARTVGIGVIPPEMAISYGLSGPMIRGSGIPYDLRKVAPYSVYDQIEFDVVTHDGGDCWSRTWVRSQEMRQSIRIVRQCIEKLRQMPEPTFDDPYGPSTHVMAKVPPKPKPKPNDVYVAIESPRGELGVYMVSDGSEKPYRMKIRGPAFVNLSVLPAIAPGHKVADLVAIVGNVDIVMGEVDR
ncbi:MAG: NADH-quinone oxidoreductase subunit D [Armatimonadetes bacterium]|nr:NADH-quinone oxidoreductase subunit D [Armatimonadota bacterium]MDW8121967.1 NADH-quinone oxidoreductase subunit D [Armatimonadota bacterium]